MQKESRVFVVGIAAVAALFPGLVARLAPRILGADKEILRVTVQIGERPRRYRWGRDKDFANAVRAGRARESDFAEHLDDNVWLLPPDYPKVVFRTAGAISFHTGIAIGGLAALCFTGRSLLKQRYAKKSVSGTEIPELPAHTEDE